MSDSANLAPGARWIRLSERGAQRRRVTTGGNQGDFSATPVCVVGFGPDADMSRSDSPAEIGAVAQDVLA